MALNLVSDRMANNLSLSTGHILKIWAIYKGELAEDIKLRKGVEERLDLIDSWLIRLLRKYPLTKVAWVDEHGKIHVVKEFDIDVTAAREKDGVKTPAAQPANFSPPVSTHALTITALDLFEVRFSYFCELIDAMDFSIIPEKTRRWYDHVTRKMEFARSSSLPRDDRDRVRSLINYFQILKDIYKNVKMIMNAQEKNERKAMFKMAKRAGGRSIEFVEKSGFETAGIFNQENINQYSKKHFKNPFKQKQLQDGGAL